MKLHPFWSKYPEFETRLLRVTDFFNDIAEETPDMIKADVDSILSSPGKMLRPAFTIMASSAGTNISENIYRVAAAVELLHTASLVHDDIIDFSPQRRGQPSLHARIGIKKAVLAGDFLLVRALELSASAHDDGLVESVNTGVSRMCLSMIEQDSGFGDLFINRQTYLGRINGKTAELFALSCKAGAVLGHADAETVEKFYQLGKSFGTAFQIYDDILDYRSGSGATGKPPGNDLKAGIPTLPLILALEDDCPGLEKLCRSRFRRFYRKKITKKIINGGYDSAAAETAKAYIRSCTDIIKSIEFADKELMLSVIDDLIKTYE